MSNRPAERRERLISSVKTAGLDALLVTSELNVRYLSGFTGDSTYLLLTVGGKPLLISDRRYDTQLAEECGGLDAYIRPPEQALPLAACQAISSSGSRTVGFEAPHVSVALHQTLVAGSGAASFVATSELVETLRAVKDADELIEIRAAVDQAIRGFNAVRTLLTPDWTERECALEMEHLLRRFGAKGFGFAPIIGVGDRAALPHYHAAEKKFHESPLVLFDWGAETHSCYRSDLTRVLLTGGATHQMRKVYEVVREAQRLAIAAIRPGVDGRKVDAVARKHIEAAGYGDLSHGLGHGFGLQIHERPRLGPNFDHVLQPGMVVTVEPGIYIRGEFGVRIEDDVLVTPDGCEVLSARLPNDWDWAQVVF
jgi:Xaa-Pro aminopeptidase